MPGVTILCKCKRICLISGLDIMDVFGLLHDYYGMLRVALFLLHCTCVQSPLLAKQLSRKSSCSNDILLCYCIYFLFQLR